MIRILSHSTRLHRRDFPLTDSDLADPLEADFVDAGEWLEISAGRLSRSAADAEQIKNLYQVLTPRGSTDMQTLGKCAVAFSRDYEVETDMYDGDDTFAVGDAVGITLHDVLDDAVNRAVFTNTLTADEDYVYGVVTEIPDNNGELLRVHVQSPYLLAG